MSEILSPSGSMRATFLVLGFLVALAGLLAWWAGGARRGWTKTSVAVEKIDEITGITYRDYEKKFVPGLEFAVGGAAVGAILVSTGALLGRKERGRG